MPVLTEITCNYKVNPIGVGLRPVFSWKYADAVKQQSYRIIVNDGAHVVWDSGNVFSNDTCGI